MNFLKKIWRNSYFRNLVYAFGVAFILIIASNIALDIFTRHGKSEPVPDFKGMRMDSVYLLAEKNNLRIEIVDSIFRPGAPRGTVFDQNPQPFSLDKEGRKTGTIEVKKNRKVFLVMNAMEPKKEILPNVVGYSLRNAKAELRNKGFGIGNLNYVPDMATNYVLKQNYRGNAIEPGVMLPAGTNIDLQLGLDSTSRSVTVPDLIGQIPENVKDILTDGSLNYKLNFDRTIRSFNDSVSARVYRQDPASGNSVIYGYRVNVFLRKENKR